MITLGSRHDITLEAYRRVAWEGETVEISAEAVDQMNAAHQGFLALIDSDPDMSVYMVTTGGGEWAKQRVKPERAAGDRTQNFNLQLAFGEPLPERVTRGFVLSRLATSWAATQPRRPRSRRRSRSCSTDAGFRRCPDTDKAAPGRSFPSDTCSLRFVRSRPSRRP